MLEPTHRRALGQHIGGGYRALVQRLPYTLTDSDRDEMRGLFRRVMEPLAFKAAPAFVENLFGTSILVRVFSARGQLAAFGNIRIRESAGVQVRHIFAVYVDPEHRGRDLSVRAIGAAVLSEAWRNRLCLWRPLYITGSAVNPIVVRSLLKRTELWPDLVGGQQPPARVLAIARDSARYYPARGERDFQVAITPEYAVLEDAGVTQQTGDDEFDARFFEVARPSEFKLLLFVARVRFRDVAGAGLQRLVQLARKRMRVLGPTTSAGRASV